MPKADELLKVLQIPTTPCDGFQVEGVLVYAEFAESVRYPL